MPFAEFKELAGIDDRDEKIARFCLLTATHTIEQYCKRRLLRKRHIERIDYTGDLPLPLREYPVGKVVSVNLFGNGEFLEPEFYSVDPDCGTDEDLPFFITLSPALQVYRGLAAVKVVYWAGYSMRNEELGMRNERGEVPGDLAAACFELASWNLNRYRGRRVGLTGNIKGGGKEGEHFELSMPENVRSLLEPYKRKVI